MANFKAVVRGERKDGFMQVYIRVTHHRMHGYIKTDKMITRKELSKSKEIKDPFVLNWCSERILEFNERLNRKDIGKWTVAEVVEYLKTGEDDICFSDYARHHIDRMVDRYQLRTAQNYRQALGHMERCYGTNKIMFGQLTSTQITRWIQSLEHTPGNRRCTLLCMRQVSGCRGRVTTTIASIQVKNPMGHSENNQPHGANPVTVKKAITRRDCRELLHLRAPS